eukprot:scaffold2022_cov261-Pinguiococcus_pyrenoidosus.AAC.13
MQSWDLPGLTGSHGIILFLHHGKVAPVEPQSPDGEDVSVRCVGDCAGSVEDSRAALLGPVPGGQLPLHEPGDPALQSLQRILGNRLRHSMVLLPDQDSPRRGSIDLNLHQGMHEPEACPSRLHDARALHAIPAGAIPRVRFIAAAEVGLPPATVLALMAQNELHRLNDRPARARLSAGHQSFDAEPRAVGEAHAPAAVPASVPALDTLQKRTPPLNAKRNLLRAVVRELLSEVDESSHGRRAAFHVAVVDHDVSEGLARVQPFVPAIAPIVLVRRPPSIVILVAEKHIHGVVHPLEVDGVLPHGLDALEGAQGQHTLQALAGAVADRPPVRRCAKGPAPLADVAVPILVVVLVDLDLSVVQEHPHLP